MDFIKRHKWEVPLYIIAAGLPLITYFHVQYTGMEMLPWFPNQTTWTDFFLYGKSKCVHLTSLVMTVILLISNIRKKTEKFDKEWLWVLLLAMLQMVSAFKSIVPRASFWGNIEQYESVWVLLGCLVIACYAYQVVIRKSEAKSLMKALVVGVLLSSLIGLTQLVQMDFWETDIGQRILIPETYRELRESLRFNFSQGSWEPVYLSSYNPNYAGIYLLMVLPCMILWKNKFVRMLAIIVLVCLVGTMSKTAIFASIFLLVLGLHLLGKSIDTKWKNQGKVVGVFLLIFAAMFTVFEKKTDSIDYENKLQSVVCEDDYVKVVYQGKTILIRDKVAYQGGVTYEIVYEDGSNVKFVWNDASGELEPLDEILEDLHFKVYEKDGISYIMFCYGDIPFRFTKDTGTGKYEYVSVNGKVDELKDAESVLEGMESFINGRGYIWSRTLPVILENPLLGTGPDTFLMAFPQDDYVVRSNLGHTFFTQLLTNAHSFYLHMAEQTGIPALICFLIFIIIYVKKSWKLYYGKYDYTEYEKAGVSLFLGVVGYLICGLTFASSVCTTPIFWMILGMGVAVNKNLLEYEKS